MDLIFIPFIVIGLMILGGIFVAVFAVTALGQVVVRKKTQKAPSNSTTSSDKILPRAVIAGAVCVAIVLIGLFVYAELDSVYGAHWRGKNLAKQVNFNLYNPTYFSQDHYSVEPQIRHGNDYFGLFGDWQNNEIVTAFFFYAKGQPNAQPVATVTEQAASNEVQMTTWSDCPSACSTIYDQNGLKIVQPDSEFYDVYTANINNTFVQIEASGYSQDQIIKIFKSLKPASPNSYDFITDQP